MLCWKRSAAGGRVHLTWPATVTARRPALTHHPQSLTRSISSISPRCQVRKLVARCGQYPRGFENFIIALASSVGQARAPAAAAAHVAHLMQLTSPAARGVGAVPLLNVEGFSRVDGLAIRNKRKTYRL